MSATVGTKFNALNQFPLSLEMIANKLSVCDRSAFASASKSISQVVGQNARWAAIDAKLQVLRENVFLAYTDSLVSPVPQPAIYLVVRMPREKKYKTRSMSTTRYYTYCWYHITYGMSIRAASIEISSDFVYPNKWVKSYILDARSHIILSLAVRMYDELNAIYQTGHNTWYESGITVPHIRDTGYEALEVLKNLLTGISYDQLYMNDINPKTRIPMPQNAGMKRMIKGGSPSIETLDPLSYKLIVEKLSACDRTALSLLSKSAAKTIANESDTWRNKEKYDQLHKNVFTVCDINDDETIFLYMVIKINVAGQDKYVKYSLEGQLPDIYSDEWSWLFDETMVLNAEDWADNTAKRFTQIVKLRNHILLVLAVRVYDELRGWIQLYQDKIREKDTLKFYILAKDKLGELLRGISIDQLYANDLNSSKVLPNVTEGGSHTIHILGRKRKVILKGRKKYITYKKQLISVAEAKKLEKCG